MHRLGSIMLCLLLNISIGWAQKSETTNPIISLSIFNENFGLNGLPTNNPVHPGGTISIAFNKKDRPIYKSYNLLEIGYFRHEPLFQTAYIAWKPQSEWQFKSGLTIHALFGVGYLHALPTQSTFVQVDGQYIVHANLGQPNGMLSLGLGLGYQFSSNHGLFIRQELITVAPFSPSQQLPLSVHSLVHVGLRFGL